MNQVLSALVSRTHERLKEGRDALEQTRFEEIGAVCYAQGRLAAYREVLETIQELLSEADNQEL